MKMSSRANEPSYRGRSFIELGGRFITAHFHGVGHAVAQVVVEENEGHRLEGTGGRRYLFEDVHAVTVFFDHALKATNLPLNPSESFLNDVLVTGVSRLC